MKELQYIIISAVFLLGLVTPVYGSPIMAVNSSNINSQDIEWDRVIGDRKSTRLNSSHSAKSRMPSSA